MLIRVRTGSKFVDWFFNSRWELKKLQGMRYMSPSMEDELYEKTYNVKLHPTDHNPNGAITYVEFASDDDAAMFMLKWNYPREQKNVA